MPHTDPATTSGARPPWYVRVGGGCWIASLVFPLGQAVAQAAATAPYSLADNTISDLGNTACGPWPPPGSTNPLLANAGVHGVVCSPWHAVMNTAFVVTGAALLLGLYLTRRLWPRRRLTTWGFVFLTLAGVGKIVVGLDPENLRIGLHTLGALGIPCANLGMLLLGLGVWRRRGMGGLSVGLGVLGLAGYVALLGLATSPHGIGTAERVADEPMVVWMVALGIGVVHGARAITGDVALDAASTPVARP